MSTGQWLFDEASSTGDWESAALALRAELAKALEDRGALIAAMELAWSLVPPPEAELDGALLAFAAEGALPVKLWLSPQDVGDLVGGFSAQFIRNEIRAGALPARYIRSRGGKMGYYRILLADARSYEARLIERALAPTSPGGVTGPTLVPLTRHRTPITQTTQTTNKPASYLFRSGADYRREGGRRWSPC